MYKIPRSIRRPRPAALRRIEPQSDARRECDQAVLNALSSSAWPNQTCTFYELGQLARHAVHEGLASPEVVDDSIIASNAIPRLLSRAPAVPALNQFLVYATRVILPRAAAAVGAATARPPLLDVLGCSRASDVAALIRAAPNGPEILNRIDADSWNNGQARSPAEPVSGTISACRFFEASNRPELARVPALRQVGLPTQSSGTISTPASCLIFFASLNRTARRRSGSSTL